MSNNKIKILSTFSFVALIVAILSFTPNFTAKADGDELIKEIADYKTWKRINKEPIKVEGGFTIDDVSGGG
jgi:hypothetical protein